MANIKVKNIYYMLTYAFSVLHEEKYRNMETEEFAYVSDLLAAILCKGVSSQVKRGLGKEYMQHRETLHSPKGKIEIAASIKEQTMCSCKLACVYDSYEENTYLNQILKSTMYCLLRSGEVKPERKKSLKKLMLYFDNVDIIELKHVHWKGIPYYKNNITYKMLISICYLVVQGLLLSEEKGNIKMSKYVDDRQMHALYEKFVLAYYRKHYPELHPMPSRVDWNEDNGYLELLPVMKTDITLEYQGRITIIDTKFYGEMLQYNQLYGSKTLHSGNLYQIFTYVKNKDIHHDGSVSGVLLYAKTEGEEALDKTYVMSGNRISVKSLDLSQDFSMIKGRLDEIVKEMLE